MAASPQVQEANMATAFIDSAANKAKAEYLLQLIDEGTLPKPPASEQLKRNQCDECHRDTMLRYYKSNVGWVCEDCRDAVAVSVCTTRADAVHRGRVHIVPDCVRFAVDAPQTPQDAPRAYQSQVDELVQRAVENLGKQQDARRLAPSWVDRQVAKIEAHRGDESIAAERRWHAGRMAGEARRGAVIARLS